MQCGHKLQNRVKGTDASEGYLGRVHLSELQSMKTIKNGRLVILKNRQQLLGRCLVVAKSLVLSGIRTCTLRFADGMLRLAPLALFNYT